MTPLMICFMLRHMIGMMDTLREEGTAIRPIETIAKMERCTNPKFLKEGDTPCATIGYSIIGDPKKNDDGQYQYIHDLMK